MAGIERRGFMTGIERRDWQQSRGLLGWWGRKVIVVCWVGLMVGAWLQPSLGSAVPLSIRQVTSPAKKPPASSPTSRHRVSSRQLSSSWMRGMTVSCFGWGAAWASPLMYRTMLDLKKLGTNWISYHPYSWIQNNGRINYRRSTRQPTVVNPLRFAKKLGLKVMLKPHIGHWGSKFDWRGSIKFKQERSWRRFFQHYLDWIVIQARMAQAGGAQIFSVGVEYRQTLHRDKDWRRIIAAVRKVYKGKITYSANWDSFPKVKFWDALDYIGIQAYFPISKKKDPSTKELRRGWSKWLSQICKFSAKFNKPVIFTELGYNWASHAAARPWDHSQGGAKAGKIKLRCMKVALEEVPKASCVKGVFLWKWFPSFARISSNYTLQYPAMRRVLRACWKK